MAKRDFFDLSPTQGKKVFILTSDLPIVVSQWLAKEFNFSNFGWGQSGNIFRKVRKTLGQLLSKALGPGVEIKNVSTHQAHDRLQQLLEKHKGTPLISLDPVNTSHLVSNPFHMDVTRIVKHDNDASGSPWKPIGHGPRNPVISVREQIQRLQRMQKNIKEAIVIDDGIWTGETIRSFAALLLEHDIRVKKFVVFFNFAPPETVLPAEVEQIFHLNREDTFDWVFEHDFIAGLPYSGRTVGSMMSETEFQPDSPFMSVPLQGNYSAPYIELLGDPHSWASIPQRNISEFSIGCLGLSISVYRAIESVLGLSQKIKVHQVPRPPFMYKTKLERPMTVVLNETIHRIRQAHSSSLPSVPSLK